MPTQTNLSRVESFPFDSRADGYDEDGYPVYDRAVGATMLRETFRKFFSDGVFPSPGTALQISKGPGLTVVIQPGIFIINGAMGGYLTDEHSLTLDTEAPQGNVCYGIMLRYDETEQYRSCYIRVVRGDAASTPQPPAPDQSTPGVMEYRLGYVTVPTGATDLTNATVTNEKGLTVCPYAAPFEKIDMSGVTADARASANEALTQLLAYFESNREAIDAALSGEEATHLQQQITALQEQLADFDIDLATEVDNSTIEYTGTENPVDPKKLRVKDGGIGTEQLADGAVTADKIADGAAMPAGGEDGDFLVSIDGESTWRHLREMFSETPVQLWEGTWDTGTITVPDVESYSVFIVSVGAPALSSAYQDQVAVPCMRVGDHIVGNAVNICNGPDGTPWNSAMLFSINLVIGSGGTLSAAGTNPSAGRKYVSSCIYTSRDFDSGKQPLMQKCTIKKIEGVLK